MHAVLTHVVLMKLTDHADAAEAKQRLEALVGAVPQLRTLDVRLDTLRAEDAYDLCLTTTHDSAADLRGYAEHPAHVALLGWLRPRLTGRAAVDYED
jgi:ABC-type antimicrobial peptide transport system ATPase subunit